MRNKFRCIRIIVILLITVFLSLTSAPESYGKTITEHWDPECLFSSHEEGYRSDIAVLIYGKEPHYKNEESRRYLPDIIISRQSRCSITRRMHEDIERRSNVPYDGCLTGTFKMKVWEKVPGVDEKGNEYTIFICEKIGNGNFNKDTTSRRAPEDEEAYKKGKEAYSRREYAEAKRWYHKAAKLGHPLGQYELGRMFRGNKGVTHSNAKAAQWFQKAAEQGVTDAQVDLGWLLQNGWGVKRDINQAIYWYRKAAEQGDETAIRALEKLGAN